MGPTATPRVFPRSDISSRGSRAASRSMARPSWSCACRDDGGLRLLLLPPAQVDQCYNEDLGEDGWVISGVHVARDGRRLRYRVCCRAPDRPFAAQAAEAIWIDAVDMCHVHRSDISRRGARHFILVGDLDAHR